MLLPASGIPQDYSVDFYTIDGSGEILAELADERWQLSGTLGQWDASESLAAVPIGHVSGVDWPHAHHRLPGDCCTSN